MKKTVKESFLFGAGFIKLNDPKLKDRGDFSGVFSLVKANGNVYYIDSSKRVVQSLSELDLKNYHVLVKLCSRERNELEKKLIRDLNPPLNARYNTLRNLEDLEGFKQWLTQFQLSAISLPIYISSVGLFLKTLKGHKFDEEFINRFLKEHPRLYVKASLKYFLKFKGLDFDMAKIKEPVRKPINAPDWLMLKNALSKITNKETYMIFKLLLDTGARISEVLKLTLNDIDLKANLLHYKVKGNKYREARLTSETLSEFKDYVNALRETGGLLGNDKIFFTTYHSLKNAYLKLRGILDKLDAPEKIFFKRTHNFRRALINKIIEETGDNIAIAKAFIGHTKIETTMRYLSEAQEKVMKSKAEKLLGVENSHT